MTEPPPDLEAIHELLGTMRETLAALVTTFDHLGEQTARVARLGPAIDTAHQVMLRLLMPNALLTLNASLMLADALTPTLTLMLADAHPDAC